MGSHTLSHSDLTKRIEDEDDQAHMERIKKEIFRSKEIIDKKLSQDTTYLAFPYGNYNQRILHLCDQAGYKIALSLQEIGNPFFADPLSLKRTQIMTKDITTFAKSLKIFHKTSLR